MLVYVVLCDYGYNNNVIEGIFSNEIDANNFMLLSMKKEKDSYDQVNGENSDYRQEFLKNLENSYTIEDWNVKL
ncbi:hypothetical protein NSS82_19185 [Paenibacillus sp. FSL H7-0735]|uniref:hypothetical protein n=1 Tax=Paenibacillus sp. FSL H7-0735 TaxID=2954736 RepID=UPI0030F9B76A